MSKDNASLGYSSIMRPSFSDDLWPSRPSGSGTSFDWGDAESRARSLSLSFGIFDANAFEGAPQSAFPPPPSRRPSASVLTGFFDSVPGSPGEQRLSASGTFPSILNNLNLFPPREPPTSLAAPPIETTNSRRPISYQVKMPELNTSLGSSHERGQSAIPSRPSPIRDSYFPNEAFPSSMAQFPQNAIPVHGNIDLDSHKFVPAIRPPNPPPGAQRMILVPVGSLASSQPPLDATRSSVSKSVDSNDVNDSEREYRCPVHSCDKIYRYTLNTFRDFLFLSFCDLNLIFSYYQVLRQNILFFLFYKFNF